MGIVDAPFELVIRADVIDPDLFPSASPQDPRFTNRAFFFPLPIYDQRWETRSRTVRVFEIRLGDGAGLIDHLGTIHLLPGATTRRQVLLAIRRLVALLILGGRDIAGPPALASVRDSGLMGTAIHVCW